MMIRKVLLVLPLLTLVALTVRYSTADPVAQRSACIVLDTNKSLIPGQFNNQFAAFLLFSSLFCQRSEKGLKIDANRSKSSDLPLFQRHYASVLGEVQLTCVLPPAIGYTPAHRTCCDDLVATTSLISHIVDVFQSESPDRPWSPTWRPPPDLFSPLDMDQLAADLRQQADEAPPATETPCVALGMSSVMHGTGKYASEETRRWSAPARHLVDRLIGTRSFLVQPQPPPHLPNLLPPDQSTITVGIHLRWLDSLRRCQKHQEKWGAPRGACAVSATEPFRDWLRGEFDRLGVKEQCWLKAGRRAPCKLYLASDGQRPVLDRWFHHAFKGRLIHSTVNGTLGVMGDMWHLAHTTHFIPSSLSSTLANHVSIARRWMNGSHVDIDRDEEDLLT